MLHHLLELMIPIVTTFLEFIGLLIILFGSIRALYYFVASKFNFEDEEVKIQLAQSLALALEFKLGAEILRSVMIREVSEVIILSAVVILRVIMTFVIHWEIKTLHADQKVRAEELEMKIKEEALGRLKNQDNCNCDVKEAAE